MASGAGKMEVRWELDCSKVAPDVRKDDDGKEKNASSSVQELTLRGTVVAQGYYGRPHELEDSASEFLCVKAGVMGVNGSVIEPIEFVIDTLSESVTLTQDHFNDCKKKFLTRKTIHGPNSISYKEDIYIGSVLIGQHLFEIEVVCDTVNSIPSKLFSYFDHIVTRGRHYWILPSTL